MDDSTGVEEATPLEEDPELDAAQDYEHEFEDDALEAAEGKGSGGRIGCSLGQSERELA